MYLEYSSCHPESCKIGIPFSQCKRYRIIKYLMISLTKMFPNFGSFFLERNYPPNVVDHVLDQVSSLSQEQALQEISERSAEIKTLFLLW